VVLTVAALIQLLGTPQWVRAGGTLALPRDGSLWLLAYLACFEEWVAREELLELLYPEVEPEVARNRLRQLLHRTRGLEWAAGLESDSHSLRWTADCDVRRFRLAFTQGDWAEVVRLYRGPLLEGTRSYDLPGFESWLESERENLQAVWRDAVLNHTAQLEQSGDYTQAMSLLERSLTLDPYAEETLQAYLRSAMKSGQREGALKVYGDFCLRLERDLGLEPEASTQKLLDALLQAPAAVQVKTKPSRVSRGFSAPLTSFIGREAELEAITTALANPGCRFLTLIGPGGMGKTRLALEALEAQRPTFTEVYFVPLEAASSSSSILSSLAQTLGFSLAGLDDPRQQLLEFLRERHCLIALDNFEQLLTAEVRGEVVELVLEVLGAAPQVKLLITSRHRLELQAEWVIPLEGLPTPTSGTLEAARRSSSARLFVERASRSKPGFALSSANAAAITRICRLTEGLPLGIELAAAWAGALEVGEIASELEINLDLSSPTSDRPERHQTLRAAFEHSWRLLSSSERDALMYLSVFRGGFERGAANQVIKASLRILLSLVNKSLLRRSLEGRFVMLEVIRQHAAERLAEIPLVEGEVRQKHLEHFLALAETLAPQLRGAEQAKSLEQLASEHDNFRAALDHALQTRQTEPALRLASALHWFWYVRGHHREGLTFLEAALALPDQPLEPRAEALRGVGWLARELGNYAAARSRLEEALTLWQTLGNRSKEAATLYSLGINSRETGDLHQAQQKLEQAAALQRELSEDWGLSTTLNDLGIIEELRNNFPKAGEYYRESLRLKEAIGDRMGVAYALANLGLVAETTAEYQTLTERSLSIKRELGDQQGMANSLFNLAEIAFKVGDLQTTQLRLEECLKLFWQLGRRRAIAATLAKFAELNAAKGHFEACLRLAGATEALVKATGFQLQGVDPHLLEGYLEAAHQALGSKAQQAYTEGLKMRLEEAVSYALERSSY